MKQLSAILIGAGNRGMNVYGNYALSNSKDIRFVAVADSNSERLAKFKALHNIADDMCFSDFNEIFTKPKFADLVLISTLDQLHYEPTIKAASLGYDILLEKPMSPVLKECVEMYHAVEVAGVNSMVCHVLRYTPFFTKIKEILDSGRIGRLMSVAHNENVAYWHIAHSFVRGNFNNSKTSSPMILAKCSHDMDILYWLCGSKPKTISSSGHLSYFKEENAPIGAPKYCIEGCPVEKTCPFYAPRQYLTDNIGWPTSMICEDMSIEARTEALKSGVHGRCVFHCDNNVVDHQVVTIDFENEVTAAFTMCGFTKDNTRTIKLMGTKGEIRGHLEKGSIEIWDFISDEPELIDVSTLAGTHSGGDEGMMRALVSTFLDTETKSENKTPVSESLISHVMAWAAEKSRLEGKTVDIAEFMRELGV